MFYLQNMVRLPKCPLPFPPKKIPVLTIYRITEGFIPGKCIIKWAKQQVISRLELLIT